MSNVESVFATAATRLRSVAGQATEGPYLMSKTVPTALRCVDAPDGSEQHLAYGIARKEDFRLLVGSDPRTFELIAEVFATSAASDAAAPALAELAGHLSQKMGLKLPPVEFPAAELGDYDAFDDVSESSVTEPVPAPAPTPAAAPAPAAAVPATAPPPQSAAVFDAADL